MQFDDIPTSRKAALAAGQTRYFTGKPCKHGHIALRQAANGTCLECVALVKPERDKEYRSKNLEKLRAYDSARNKGRRQQWVRNNPEKSKAQKARYYQTHRERILKEQRETRASKKEVLSEYFRNYKRNNKGKVNATNKKREVAKKQRIPAWLTPDDFWFISEIYDLAALRSAATGVIWHVDHIVPLQGKSVSGLHVPTNLRVILGQENLAKNNAFNP